MQKHILRAALLLSLLLAFAKPLLASNVTLIMPGQADKTTPAQLSPDQYPPQPALFKFRNGNATVYLFGTAHSILKGVKWRTNEFNRALANSDRIWFETTDRQMANPVLRDDLILTFKNKDGTRIEDILNREEMAKLTKVARAQNFDIDEYGQLHPWVIAQLLWCARYQSAIKKDPKQEVEAVFGVEEMVEAMGLGKPILPLEDTRSLMMIYSQLSPAAEKAYLLDTLDQIDLSQKKMLTEIMGAWSKGDLNTLNAIVDKYSSHELYEIFLTRRNKLVFKKIEALLQGSGTEFVGVGAGHITGPGGLVSLLEKAGYKAERIYDTEPPVASETERKQKVQRYRTMLLTSNHTTVALTPGHNPDEVLLHLSHDRALSGCMEISPLKTKVVKSDDLIDVNVLGYWHNIHPYPNTDGCGTPVKFATADIPLSLAQLKKNKKTDLKLQSRRGYTLFILTYEDGTLTIAPKKDQIIDPFILDTKKLALTGL